MAKQLRNARKGEMIFTQLRGCLAGLEIQGSVPPSVRLPASVLPRSAVLPTAKPTVAARSEYAGCHLPKNQARGN